jgi:hypothetical protein
MAKKNDREGPVWCTMHDKAAQDCQSKGHGPDQLPPRWYDRKGK